MISNDVAIVLDDHQLFGESFSVLLEKYTKFDTVHTFQYASELTSFLSEHSRKKFYLFLDYYLQNSNGLAVLSDVKRINKLCKNIFLTSASSWPVLHHIESHSPDGIISKVTGLDVLLECINEVEKGNSYRCPIFQEIKTKNISNKPITFTARELEILQYFASGNTIAQTAEITYLSHHTIVSHRRNMMAKVNSTTIGQLLNYAKEWKLI